jgi:hypothetical protein
MKRIAKVSALAAVISMMLAGWGHAADQTILGRSFIVKNSGAPAQRKVTGAAKEVGSSNTIVGDPTVPGSAGGAILGSAGGAILGSAGGAVLTVIADGDHPSQQIFPLKQGTSSTGKPFWRTAGVSGFKYKDPNGQQGAVKVVLIKKNQAGVFSIKVTIRGKGGTINVVPPNLGTDGFITLLLGDNGDRYCVAYVGGSTVNDGDRLFKVRRPTVEACPPGTGSPNPAFVDGPSDLSD